MKAVRCPLRTPASSCNPSAILQVMSTRRNCQRFESFFSLNANDDLFVFGFIFINKFPMKAASSFAFVLAYAMNTLKTDMVKVRRL